VVEDKQEDVLVRAEFQEMQTDREIVDQVEGLVGGSRQTGGELPSGDRFCEEGEIERVGRKNLLPGDAGLGREAGAERLVADQQVVEGETEGVEIKWAGEAASERDVVGGTGALELDQKPHAQLGGGEGDAVGARLGNKGRANGEGAGAGAALLDMVGE